MTAFTLTAAALLGNLPLICAVIGHVRAHRIQDELDAAEWAGTLRTSWHDPTPPTPLRAVAWPVRQSPTDLAAAYDPVPWTRPNWAVEELALIVGTERLYQRTLARAA